MKKCAIYIRVSTDAQMELSPDAQRRLLLEYAAKNKYSVIDTYLDGGISGRKADKRPEFMRMISDAKQGAFDAILVWKFSRFARNMEESIVYKKMLSRSNVEVVSISEPLPDGPIGTLVERIFEWMDEYYSINLGQEARRGMAERARRGKFSGVTPYGYDCVDGLLVPNADAEIVRRIFNEYANGQTRRAIALHLNEEGLITRRGSKWRNGPIAYILTNRAYIGELVWGKTNRGAVADDAICESDNHEPIIERDVFDAVQERYNSEKKHYSYSDRVTINHYLVGSLRCCICGSAMSYTSNKSPYSKSGYYVRWICPQYSHGNHREKCGFSLSRIEPHFLTALEYVAAKSDGIVYAPYVPPVTRDNSRAIAHLREKLARCKEAYRDGIDTLDEYKENKTQILAEIDALEEKTPEPKNKKETQAEVHSLVELLRSDADMFAKRAAVMAVVDSVVFDPRSNELTLSFKP